MRFLIYLSNEDRSEYIDSKILHCIVSYIKSLPDSEVTFAGCNNIDSYRELLVPSIQDLESIKATIIESNIPDNRFTKEFLTKHNCDMPKDESNMEYNMYIDYKGILYQNKDMNTPYAVTYQDKIELEE